MLEYWKVATPRHGSEILRIWEIENRVGYRYFPFFQSSILPLTIPLETKKSLFVLSQRLILELNLKIRSYFMANAEGMIELELLR